MKHPALIDRVKRLRASVPAEDAARARGVALYRAGKWKDAASVFEKSMELGAGGDAHDWIYLAMALGQLGHTEKAREFYDKAVAWIEKHKPKDEELARLRAEAKKVLGIEDGG